MINYKKSHIQFSRNTPPKFIRFMRKPLGVRSQEKLGSYLGCPMDVDGRTTSTFNQIHDSVLQCISSWKYSCLNPAARSILINSILEDIWAGKEQIAFRNRDFENQPGKPKYVSDIIDGQSWNANKVWNWFKRDSAQRILSTYLPKEEIEDEIIWCQEENGDYSVKSGYWYLQNQRKRGRNHTETKFWKRLWKTPMSQRWRMFCWKLAHNALPTKENLSKRKITQNSSCVICGNVESASHLFLYCEVSKRIWSSSSLGWALLIANLWAIWTHRNNVIFREAAVNPYGVMEVAKVEMERWYNGFGSKGSEDRMQGIEEGRGPCSGTRRALRSIARISFQRFYVY
ncbi:hypothetical protein RDABS01_032773 [Bienertia sinuspersici]